MNRFLLMVAMGFVLFIPSFAQAATIFESSTLGPVGIPFSDLVSGSVPSTNANANVYTGVRFQLIQPVITSQIGGHFVGKENGTFFGAIVALDDENDFPDSNDFSAPDVLGSTVLTFPIPSDEVFGDLSLSLDAGWYAIVFGSGLLGATGNGSSVRNGMGIGSRSYIGLQPGSAFGWFNITTFPDQRFVVEGQIVPEASSIALVSMALPCFLFRRKMYRASRPAPFD